MKHFPLQFTNTSLLVTEAGDCNVASGEALTRATVTTFSLSVTSNRRTENG